MVRHFERFRLLKTSGSVGQYQRVPEARHLVRLDRCRFMDDPRVVHQEHGKWLRHGESPAGGAVRIEHVRLAAADAETPDQHDGDKIHPVAMGPLRRRASNSGCGIDAKLMRLDEPAPDASDLRKRGTDRSNQARPDGRSLDLRLDRFEPALDAAVQGVVGGRLPVGTMRNNGQPARVRYRLNQAGVATRTVTAAVAQIIVRGQAGPRIAQRAELPQRDFERLLSVGGRKEGVAVACDALDDLGKEIKVGHDSQARESAASR